MRIFQPSCHRLRVLKSHHARTACTSHVRERDNLKNFKCLTRTHTSPHPTLAFSAQCPLLNNI